jgi:hypothetical protein
MKDKLFDYHLSNNLSFMKKYYWAKTCKEFKLIFELNSLQVFAHSHSAYYFYLVIQINQIRKFLG